MLFTSPSAPAAAQKTYSKVLGSASPAPRAVVDPPTQAVRSMQDELANPKPGVWEQFTQVAPAPSEPVRAYLDEQGWSIPEPETLKSLQKEYRDNSLRPLQDYDYEISAEEGQILQQVYEGAPGVVVPERSAQEALQRQKNPGLNRGVLTSEGMQSMELTWEQYDALNEDQKRAIDWNTLFLDAREQDLGKSRPSPDEETRKKYDEDIASMFGEKGGTEVYAPETVALLKQINFSAVGQDIDEYLSLDRLVSMDELKDFKINTAELKKLANPSFDELVAARSGNQPAAAEARAVRAAGRAVDQAMRSPEFAGPDLVNTMLRARGATPRASLTEDAFASPEKQEFFTGAWLTLLNQGEQGLADIYQKLDEVGADETDRQELFDFLGRRSDLESEWGRAGDFSPDTLTPEEVRALLGMGTREERTRG